MSKLKKGGVFSVALPTDPSFLWRMGRLFMKFFIKKNKIYQLLEYDYLNSLDHINNFFHFIIL